MGTRLGDLVGSLGGELIGDPALNVAGIGPLKLSLGYPMNAKPGDYTQRFQFQLGTGF